MKTTDIAPTSDSLHKLSDKEVIEELTRNGWVWDHPHVTPAERQIALIQEALCRILQHQINAPRN